MKQSRLNKKNQYAIISIFPAYGLIMLAFRLFLCGSDYPPSHASNVVPTSTDFLLQAMFLGIFFFTILLDNRIERWKPAYLEALIIFTFSLYIINELIGYKFLAYLGGKLSYLYVLFWLVVGGMGILWAFMDKRFKEREAKP